MAGLDESTDKLDDCDACTEEARADPSKRGIMGGAARAGQVITVLVKIGRCSWRLSINFDPRSVKARALGANGPCGRGVPEE